VARSLLPRSLKGHMTNALIAAGGRQRRRTVAAPVLRSSPGGQAITPGRAMRRRQRRKDTVPRTQRYPPAPYANRAKLPWQLIATTRMTIRETTSRRTSLGSAVDVIQRQMGERLDSSRSMMRVAKARSLAESAEGQCGNAVVAVVTPAVPIGYATQSKGRSEGSAQTAESCASLCRQGRVESAGR
jgi:hypothetical protein